MQQQTLRIENTNTPATDEDIKRIEAAVGFALPADYRQFLMKYNGGVPYNNTFDVPSVIYSKFLYNFVVARFLAINPKGQDDILRTRENLKGQLPPGSLPVAIDRFRNFMCLLPETGEIVFYDLQSALKSTQLEPTKGIIPQQYTYHIAESFSHMLGELYHKRFT